MCASVVQRNLLRVSISGMLASQWFGFGSFSSFKDTNVNLALSLLVNSSGVEWN